MAIDFFCYSSLPPEDAVMLLDMLSKHEEKFFKNNFIISTVKDLRGAKNYYDTVEIEIALEHGLHANSSFIISLNEKSATNLIVEMLEVLRKTMGNDRLIITSDGGMLR